MTEELKTLKDLKFINNPNPICKTIKSEIRAEAVKWVKWLNTAEWDKMKDFNSNDEFGSGHEGLDYFIKHFFNITEEDLKEKKE